MVVITKHELLGHASIECSVSQQTSSRGADKNRDHYFRVDLFDLNRLDLVPTKQKNGRAD